MNTTIRCLIVGLLLSCWSIDVALAQDTIPPPEFIFAGIRDARERLRCGAFRGTGTVIDNQPQYGRLEGKVEVASAFNYDLDLFRFDRTEAIRVSPSGGNPLNHKDWVVGSEGGRYVKTSKRTITWFNGDTTAAVIGPATRKADPRIQPFDIRIVGCCTYGEIKINLSFQDRMSYLVSIKGASVSREADDTLKLKWSIDAAATQYIYVDERNGYLPLRTEVHEVRAGKDQLSEVSTAQWKKVNDVWVPKHVFYATYGEPNIVKSYDMTLEWDHVNKPVPEEIFTVQGLSLPDGLRIVSNETGKVVMLGKVGDKDYKPAEINSDIFGDGSRLRRRLWIGGGVAVVVLVIGGYFLRRRQLRRRAVAT